MWSPSDDLHNTQNNNISLPPSHDHAGGQRRWWKQSMHTLWYAISAGGAIILDNSCRARTWSDLSNSSASSNNNAIMALIYIYMAHNMLYMCVLCVWKTPFHIIYISSCSQLMRFTAPRRAAGAGALCCICVRYWTCERAHRGRDTHRTSCKKTKSHFMNARTQAQH